MFNFMGLSYPSIRRGLIRMNQRIFLGSVLGVILLPCAFRFAPGNFLYTPTALVTCLCLLEVAIACYLLDIFGPKLLEKPFGLVAWRTFFCCHATLYAAAAGYGITYMLVELPGDVYGISLLSALLFGSAVGVSVFNFDLAICTVYIVTIMAAPTYASFVILPNAIPLGVTCLMTIIFFLFLAWSIRNAEIGAMLSEDLIKEQAQALRESHEQTLASNNLFQSTIDSIDEVFLTIDLKGICFGNVSARCEDLLGMNPVGQAFTDVLRLRGTEKQAAERWFQTARTNAVLFDKLREHGPAGWTDELRQRTFRVSYFPMLGRERSLDAVIITMNDVTAQVRAQRAAEEAEGRAAMILAISEQRGAFARFIAEITGFFEDLAAGRRQDLVPVRQQLHNLKGTARLLELRAIAAEINAFEIMLKGHDRIEAEAHRHAEHFTRFLRGWLEVEATVLAKLKIFNTEEVTFTRSRLAQVRRSFAPAFASAFDDVVRRLGATGLYETLEAFKPHVQRVARRLGKAATLEIDYHGERVLLVTDKFAVVLKALVHVLNNALDHGIETAPERVLAGKAECSVLRIGVERGVNHIVLDIRDDGRGIDVYSLRVKLRERGEAVDGLNDEDVMKSIFQAGVTTKDRADDLSGHGIGLSALFDAVRDVDGAIEVTSRLNEGTRFRITLPITAGDVVVVAAEDVSARAV